MKRKLLFLLLPLILCGTNALAHDIEVDGIYYVYTNNKTELSVSYRGTSYSSYSKEYSGNVVIPESVTYNGTTYPVTSIGSYAFCFCTGLTSVTIPNSVTSIGSSAFHDCYGLSSVTIPNSVTTIGDYTFYNCSNLTSVTIPSSVTYIGRNAFEGTNYYNNQPDGLIYAGSVAYKYKGTMPSGTSVILKDGTTGIADDAFNGCSGLTSVTIPSSVTSIGSNAFRNCSGLTSVTIPSSVTTIGSSAFSGTTLTEVTINSDAILGKTYTSSSNLSGIFGSKVTKYTIGNDVKSIGAYAFNGCSGLTSVTIPNSVTSIGSSAFSGTSLTEVTINSDAILGKTYTYSSNLSGIFGSNVGNLVIGNDVKSIGAYAFYRCSGLTSVTIPSSVTSIGEGAFIGCSGLTSVTIPSSVTYIGSNAFEGTNYYNNQPDGLIYAGSVAYKYKGTMPSGTSVVLKDGTTCIAGSAFYECTGLTSVTIPNSVTSIGSSAFYNCSSLTSVTIPSSVTSIGSSAFSGCPGLSSVTIPSSVTSIGSSAFSGTTLTEVTINSDAILGKTYTYSSNLTDIFGSNVGNLVIGNDVKSIGAYAFYCCSGLTSVTIPSSVTSIGYSAFSSCSGLTSVTIGNSVTSIGRDVFPSATKIYAEKGKVSVLALWSGDYTVYDKDTQKSLPKPTLSYSSTQSTVKLTINNRDDSYKYKITSGTKVAEANVLNLSLYPDYSNYAYLYAAEKNSEDWYSLGSKSYSTSSLNASVSTTATTASSLSVKGSYTQGDATVTAQKLQINGTTYDVSDGKAAMLTGLNPNKEYTATYTVTANGQTYTKTGKFTTAALTLTTRQPKVVSAGNVIVAAASNISEEEENVGFEWRRTDWTDDFASNTGTAYVYTDGTAGTNMIEGYIRNLNTEKLWKYRPYYLANDGTYYYGDWVGLDPTNTSYFEPTVHTYAKVDVQGNTALVKGYALRGSDNVTVKGFMYWKNAGKSAPKLMAVTIPANAKTLTVTGSSQIMTASLSDLDYDAEYSYVSFMTTSEGDTYYGEVQTFRTEADVTGISEVTTTDEPAAEASRMGIYTLSGVKLSDDSSRLRTLPAGVYIVNGKKVVKK